MNKKPDLLTLVIVSCIITIIAGTSLLAFMLFTNRATLFSKQGLQTQSEVNNYMSIFSTNPLPVYSIYGTVNKLGGKNIWVEYKTPTEETIILDLKLAQPTNVIVGDTVLLRFSSDLRITRPENLLVDSVHLSTSQSQQSQPTTLFPTPTTVPALPPQPDQLSPSL